MSWYNIVIKTQSKYAKRELGLLFTHTHFTVIYIVEWQFYPFSPRSCLVFLFFYRLIVPFYPSVFYHFICFGLGIFGHFCVSGALGSIPSEILSFSPPLSPSFAKNSTFLFWCFDFLCLSDHVISAKLLRFYPFFFLGSSTVCICGFGLIFSCDFGGRSFDSSRFWWRSLRFF